MPRQKAGWQLIQALAWWRVFDQDLATGEFPLWLRGNKPEQYPQDASSIPGLTQCVKDPALP